MKIRSTIKRIFSSKQSTLLAILLTLLILAVPVIAKAAWGPDRPIFDYNNAKDRIGSTTGPVFDSFINTPSYGDERNFVRVSTDNGAHWVEKVNVQPGQEVMVRAYVHNNANEDMNGTNFTGKSVAKNTKVRFYVPTGQANGFDIGGYISADNAKPGRVYDTATINSSSQPVGLMYEPGTAKLYNNGPFKHGTKVSDGVVAASGSGALIGYNALNGVFPGCFDFEAVVIIKIKVVAPKLQFTKQVTTPGSTNWQKTITAKTGDTVSWLLNYKNVGSANMNNITLRDAMPANATLVHGSITWFDINNPKGTPQPDTVLSSGGINVGNYAPSGGGYIRFRTTINQNPKECSVNNVAFAKATNVPEISDNASVTIADCHPTKPEFSCNLLSAKLVSDKTYDFSVNASAAGGANIVSYVYDFGDGTQPLTTDQTSVEHTYTKDGKFAASVSVNVKVGGQNKIVTSESCKTVITITTPPTTVTTTPPTTLVNTGPGDIIAGIFTGTSLLGAFLHRKWTLRKR